MLIIELNEFSAELLSTIADRSSLRHVQSILSSHHTKTSTTDLYDSGFLEPWVQWVSVHTGTPSATHSIKHLGDIPNLDQEQMWERWSNRGIRSVIWGVMNGSRRKAERCEVFIPDPWAFSEDAYPSGFQSLVSLPRYLAKNYLDFSKLKAALEGAKLIGRLVVSMRFSDFVAGLRVFWKGYSRFGPANVVFIVFFEYLSAMAFIRVVERLKPDAAVVFLNMVAHVQHHYWKDRSGLECPQLQYTVASVDEILGKIRARCTAAMKDDRVAVLNALSQGCTSEEDPWILYRPKSHEALIELIDISAVRVEPLMTYDAHVFFADQAAAAHGIEVLSTVMVGEIPLFHVEADPHNKRKVFYRVALHDPVDEAARLTFNNRSALFAEHFVAIVQRTGKHTPAGDLFTNFEGPGRTLSNHEAGRWLEVHV
jgi:hypothetical protein